MPLIPADLQFRTSLVYIVNARATETPISETNYRKISHNPIMHFRVLFVLGVGEGQKLVN